MKLVFRLLFSAIAVLAIAFILPGVHVDSITVALVVAAVLAFLNAFLKPVLILLTIPITLFTFGLFLLVINAILILFTDYLIDGFTVDSFFWALLFSLLLSMASSIYERLERDNRRKH
jgi:putative membrane protein